MTELPIRRLTPPPRRLIRRALAVLGITLSAPVAVHAAEVYRTVDDEGVVSFSDVATDGATRVEIESSSVPEGSLERQQAMIEQQLAVAKSLEESRLAREEARTRRLEALADQEPRVVYRDRETTRYVGGFNRYRWGYGPSYPGYPGHPGVPGHPGWPGPPMLPIEPPPDGGGRLDPPSRPVPLPPLKGDG